MVNIEAEKQLIAEIKESDNYKFFVKHRLNQKIAREEKAWELINLNRGNYTKELIDRFFYVVDHEEGFGWWFGKMLSSNKKAILDAPIEDLSNWIDYICFSGKPIIEIIDISLGEMRVKNAHRGLATLLLYLSDPSKFTIWMKTSHEGLFKLGRVGKARVVQWGAQYIDFNTNALEFASIYGFGHREIDWILWFIKNNVSFVGLNYKVRAV